MEKARNYDRAMRDQADAAAKLQMAQQDRDRYRLESEKVSYRTSTVMRWCLWLCKVDYSIVKIISLWYLSMIFYVMKVYNRLQLITIAGLVGISGCIRQLTLTAELQIITGDKLSVTPTVSTQEVMQQPHLKTMAEGIFQFCG